MIEVIQQDHASHQLDGISRDGRELWLAVFNEVRQKHNKKISKKTDIVQPVSRSEMMQALATRPFV